MTTNNKKNNGAHVGLRPQPRILMKQTNIENCRTQGEDFELASPRTVGEVSTRRAIARAALASGAPHKRASQDKGLSLHPGEASNISSPTQPETELACAHVAQRSEAKENR